MNYTYEADKWNFIIGLKKWHMTGFSSSRSFASLLLLHYLSASLSHLFSPPLSHLMRHLPAAVPLLLNVSPHPVSWDHRNICLWSDLQTPRALRYTNWLHCTFQLRCVDMYSNNVCVWSDTQACTDFPLWWSLINRRGCQRDRQSAKRYELQTCGLVCERGCQRWE